MPVVDASLVVALALDDERAPAVEDLMRRWAEADAEMHAPALLLYEVASGLTRATAAGAFPSERLSAAWSMARTLPLRYHHLEDGQAVVEIALHLERRSAYDAAYLALARQLGSEVWTLDASLVRNAGPLGYPVQMVEQGRS